MLQVLDKSWQHTSHRQVILHRHQHDLNTHSKKKKSSRITGGGGKGSRMCQTSLTNSLQTAEEFSCNSTTCELDKRGHIFFVEFSVCSYYYSRVKLSKSANSITPSDFIFSSHLNYPICFLLFFILLTLLWSSSSPVTASKMVDKKACCD